MQNMMQACRAALASAVRKVPAGVACLGLWGACHTTIAADWPAFRGADHTSAAAGSIPEKWDIKSGENVAWTSNLPGRGVSGPIVVQDRVVVTCSSGPQQEKLHVVCFDASTGKQLWERQFWATGHTSCHPTSAVAAPTPASDGERIYAFYSSNDLICLDLEGNLLWYRGLTHDFPEACNDVGMAASPVVANDTVIVQVECKGTSFAAGINTLTGETRWQQEREQAMNWSSPVVAKGANNASVVLLQSPTKLTAHDPLTGSELWSLPEACNAISSSTPVGQDILVPSGGLCLVRQSSGATTPEIVWQENRLGSNSASPVVLDDRVFVLKGAILVSAELENGTILSELRLKGGYWATPVVSGNLLLAVNQEGLATVVSIEGEPKIVGEYELGEPVLGSPAIADNAVYIRSDGHLWKISAK